jgi:hypothetical protein
MRQPPKKSARCIQVPFVEDSKQIDEYYEGLAFSSAPEAITSLVGETGRPVVRYTAKSAGTINGSYMAPACSSVVKFTHRCFLGPTVLTIIAALTGQHILVERGDIDVPQETWASLLPSATARH